MITTEQKLAALREGAAGFRAEGYNEYPKILDAIIADYEHLPALMEMLTVFRDEGCECRMCETIGAGLAHFTEAGGQKTP